MKMVDQVYQKTPIGGIGTVNCVKGDLDSLESFKAAISYMDDLQNQGKILITYKHEESAHRHIDLVMFRRLE